MSHKLPAINQMDAMKSVRKMLPPPSRPFSDKRGKQDRKSWKKETW